MPDRDDGPASVLGMAQPPLRRFLPGLALGLLSSLSSVALLATSAWLITRASEHPPVLFLSAAIVGVRAFALGKATFRYAERLAGHSAALRQLGALRVGVYRRLENAPPRRVGGPADGDVMTRLVTDVDALPDLPLRVVQPLVVSVVTATAAVGFVAVVFPTAAIWLALFLAAGFLAATALQSLLARRAELSIAPLRGLLAGRILGATAVLDVLVAFDAAETALASIEEANRRLTRVVLRRAVGTATVSAVLALLGGAAVIVALPLGGAAHSAGLVSAPLLTVMVLVPLAAFDAIGSAPVAVSVLRQVRSSAARIAELSGNADTATPAAAMAPEFDAGAPVIALAGLSTGWVPGHPVIDGVDLELAPGDRLLLTGTTGSGKSTLAMALVGFLPYAGSYRLCGAEVRDLDRSTVHATVGLCEQRPHLFDESLRQNVLFARPSASEGDLESVVRQVGLGPWMDARDGLDTRLGDDGSLVSGGQAQRIALARALLAEFPVIVFDEPTANVDAPLADRLLRDILAASADGRRVVIVISHAAVPAELVTKRLDLAHGESDRDQAQIGTAGRSGR